MKETKVFDPADGFSLLTDLAEITDATVAKRGNRWWMCAAGQIVGKEEIYLFSASLPEGAPLSATGWNLTTRADDPTKIEILAGYDSSAAWDFKGGRHCPSYVKGWDPERGAWVERIYYAGAAESPWGPYSIGYLEWNGSRWIDQAAPVFVANQEWERGSVYEPNLIYSAGKWKMWYVAGANRDDYLVHGFSESEDGRTNWTDHKVFAAPEEKVFDFCVVKRANVYEAVFSRVWLGKTTPPSKTGLWWCRADEPGSSLAEWSEPVQILTAEDKGWRKGPWKPSVQHSDTDANRMFVFFDGIYNSDETNPFSFVFTMGCLELETPNSSKRST